MKCYRTVCVPNAEFSNGWLERTQTALFERWKSETGHIPGASNGTWACEIYRKCRSRHEHFRLPCSLLFEANEIGWVLSAKYDSESPATFLRFYLVALFEFCSQLSKIGKQIAFRCDTPRNLSIWANRWAKHRFEFHVHDHPLMLFADQHPDQWDDIQASVDWTMMECEGDAGKPVRILPIDTEWLSNAHQRVAGNYSGKQPLIVVPRLATFLEATIGHYRSFVESCLANAEAVRGFESKHVSYSP